MKEYRLHLGFYEHSNQEWGLWTSSHLAIRQLTLRHDVERTREHGSECGHRLNVSRQHAFFEFLVVLVVVHAILTRCQSSSKNITQFQTRALHAAHSGGKTHQTAALRYVHVSVWWKRIGCTKLFGVMNSEKLPSLRAGEFLCRVSDSCVLGYYTFLNTLCLW
jgi:hypothetical protein